MRLPACFALTPRTFDVYGLRRCESEGGEARKAGIPPARRMADAAARLLDSSMEAPPTAGAGGQIQQPSRANPLVSNVDKASTLLCCSHCSVVHPKCSVVIPYVTEGLMRPQLEGAENRLFTIAETVGFSVNTSPSGRPGGADGTGNAGHAQAGGPPAPRDFSNVDLTLSKDHWDPLSDARWSQAANIVSRSSRVFGPPVASCV